MNVTWRLGQAQIYCNQRCLWFQSIIEDANSPPRRCVLGLGLVSIRETKAACPLRENLFRYKAFMTNFVPGSHSFVAESVLPEPSMFTLVIPALVKIVLTAVM